MNLKLADLELQTLRQFSSLLKRVSPRALSARERETLGQVLRVLQSEASEIKLPEADFTEKDLEFIDLVRGQKVPADLIAVLKDTMLSVIENPSKGKKYSGDIFTGTFSKMLPPVSGKVFISKLIIRRKYRLIYAYGPGLPRPVFLEFDHRKDVYKHKHIGTSS